MAIRTIQHDEPLETVWEELVYTEARLLKDARAKDLAPVASGLIDGWTPVHQGRLQARRGEIVAQAGVDAADESVDDTVEEIARETLHVVKNDRRNARFTRYFGEAPSSIIRMGLKNEMERVRPWVDSLRTEKEETLTALGGRLEGDLSAGQAALAERETTGAARSDFRVRQVISYIDDVNAARLSLYSALLGRVKENKLSKEWPERFFRRTQRAPRAPGGATE